MSWQVIAKKEFGDAARSLVLWIVSIVFVISGMFMVGSYIAFGEEFAQDTQVGALDAMVFVLSPIALLVPIISLVVGYKSIVGERESGSLKVLLSLPHTRWDVMFGKLIGRTLVVVIPLIAALVVMGAMITIFIEPVGGGSFLILFLLSLLLAAVFVAIAVAISGATGNSTVAGAAMFGIYVLFLVFWDIIDLGVLYLLEGRITPGPNPPGVYYFFDMLSPDGAYTIAAQELLPEVNFFGDMYPASVPWYLSEWIAIGILLAWLIIPFALGYYRFREADL